MKSRRIFQGLKAATEKEHSPGKQWLKAIVSIVCLVRWNGNRGGQRHSSETSHAKLSK